MIEFKVHEVDKLLIIEFFNKLNIESLLEEMYDYNILSTQLFKLFKMKFYSLKNVIHTQIDLFFLLMNLFFPIDVLDRKICYILLYHNVNFLSNSG